MAGRTCAQAWLSGPHEAPTPGTTCGQDGSVVAEDELLRCFANVRCLRTFLPLADFEFDCVPLLQALVALRGNGAVMHKDIRPGIATDEPVAFGIVEPLDRTFQTFHVRPPRQNLVLGS